jgi:hypothetical protein
MVRDRGWAGALLQWEWRGLQLNAEQNPELVALVRQLRRRQPKGGQRSLREISAELAGRGHLNERGNAFSAASIASMLARQTAA